MKFDAFLGGSNRTQSPIADSERTINFYLELADSPAAKGQRALYPSPGFLTVFDGHTDQRVRGSFAQSGRAWAVIGAQLYELFWDGATMTGTVRGAVATNSLPATFSSNGVGGNQLFITSGDLGYVLDLVTHALTHVVSSVRMGGFLAGRFLALDVSLSEFRISDVENGLVWPADLVAQRQLGGDPWVSMMVFHGDIWLFGSVTREIWASTGAFPFPFEPIPGSLGEHGILAPFSVATLDGSLVWLGQNDQGQGTVWRVAPQTYTPVEISTQAVAVALQTAAGLSDGEAYAYQEHGHTFYVLVLPAATETWVYDAKSGVWAERLYWSTRLAQWQAQRPITHMFAFGMHLVGDRSSGVIYQASVNLKYDVDGAVIRRFREGPPVADENKRLFCNAFEADFETGLGTATGQGVDPTAMLSVSSDGGRLWAPERWRSMGKQGEYRTRVRWLMLGSGRDLRFRLVVTDPVYTRLVGAFLTLSSGTS